jgi:predicted Zn-dependent protease
VIGESNLIELLRGAVAAARAAGASDADATYEGGTLGVTRFANSSFTQAGIVEDGRARVRAALGDRVGAATTSIVTKHGLATAAKAAVEIARHQRPSDFGGFARSGEQSAGGATIRTAWSEATASFGPGDRAEALSRVFAHAATAKLLCAGAFRNGPREMAVVTDGGVAKYHRDTAASLEIIALDGDASGHASFYGGDVRAIDLDALAETAVDKASRSRTRVDVPPGPMDTVLCAPAVSEAMEWMAMTGFSARALLDGMSLLTGQQGRTIMAPAVTIADDPTYAHPNAVPLPFDSDGMGKQVVTFVDRGVGGRVVNDRPTARKLADDRGSTGHAAPIGDDLTEGPAPTNLVFHPGGDSVEQLVGKVERGLYVTRFHYVNGFLDTRRAVMTGMTRDGTFLIDNGKLGAAVNNLRWTESFWEALGAARLGGIGRELKASATTWTSVGGYLCPAILVRGFRFTGRSR